MRPEALTVQKVRLAHHSAPLSDIPGAVWARCAPLRHAVRPGMRVAVAVGSRGIAGIDVIVRSLVALLREAGAAPFIVPAMGSHGGATAEGQAAVLAGYGITERAMGAPIRSSMEVVTLGTTGGPVDIPVYMDRIAHEADGIVAVNRVKAHTDFHGPHESGIVKMLTIGLGKHAQAIAVHRHGADGLRDQIPRIASAVLHSGKILGALAILEDGRDQTSDLGFAAGEEAIFALDSAFLARSKSMMARLPFDAADVLVVDRMGKDYSGTGMDTNVIGRLAIRGQPDDTPRCARIVTLDLSEASHGNALGMGLADIATRRLADKIDWRATNANVATSGFLARGFLPFIAESDREAIALALSTCGPRTPEAIRFARISNTLHLDAIYVSPALLSPEMTPLSDPMPLAFDPQGTVHPF